MVKTPFPVNWNDSPSWSPPVLIVWKMKHLFAILGWYFLYLSSVLCKSVCAQNFYTSLTCSFSTVCQFLFLVCGKHCSFLTSSFIQWCRRPTLWFTLLEGQPKGPDCVRFIQHWWTQVSFQLQSLGIQLLAAVVMFLCSLTVQNHADNDAAWRYSKQIPKPGVMSASF